MDLSKLNSNERLAFWGAVVSIVGTILTIVGAYGFAGGLWLTFLLAIAMIVILFLPTWSPGTTLPGSKGSLMLIVGGIAAVGSLLALLSLLSLIAFLGIAPLFVLGLIVGIVGGFMMGWAGWQEFQAEGGKFQLGSASGGTATASRTDRPVETTSTTTTTTSTSAASAPPAATEPASTATYDDSPRSEPTMTEPTMTEPTMTEPAPTDSDVDRPYDRDERSTP